MDKIEFLENQIAENTEKQKELNRQLNNLEVTRPDDYDDQKRELKKTKDKLIAECERLNERLYKAEFGED